MLGQHHRPVCLYEPCHRYGSDRIQTDFRSTSNRPHTDPRSNPYRAYIGTINTGEFWDLGRRDYNIIGYYANPAWVEPPIPREFDGMRGGAIIIL
jgi:hypothetical protein